MAILLSIISASWAALALALGLWSLAVIFIAMQMEHVWWLWDWAERSSEEDRFIQEWQRLAAALHGYERADLGEDRANEQRQSRLPEDDEEQ